MLFSEIYFFSKIKIIYNGNCLLLDTGLFSITIVVTDIALTANMGVIVEICCSRIVSHHNLKHSVMEAQSFYVYLKDLLDRNN